HVIVAVATAGLDLAPGDPVAEGFLFIDATETLGSPFWLPPPVQDQEALLLRGEQSRLVRTPVAPTAESRHFEIALAPPAGEGSGPASGEARLTLTGEEGAAWVNHLATRRPEENEAEARSLLAGALPGATFAKLAIEPSRQGVPALKITAQVQLPGFLRAGEPNPSFQLPTLRGLPASGLLEGRTLPMVLTPAVTRSVWKIRLPQGSCPPAAQDVAVRNELGSFEQKVVLAGDLLTVERQTEVRQRWIDPERFPALRELAVAELKARKRMVRLECPAGR
ncbi:MAG TPA: hypothetical protein VMM92_10070, partial [Thermoanaerobaculia bacterium]|nr:hypothetical protein [Thermoanaerobaculia bacterium]